MLFLTVSTMAYAASGQDVDQKDSMAMILVALFMIGSAYLLAHFVVDRLQRKYLFVSGVEYILLGLGLSFFHIFQDSSTFMPAIAFALGWVGILYGLRGNFKARKQNSHVIRF